MNLANNVIKWAATALTIFGALATVNAWDPVNIWAFNLGSLAWLWWAIRTGERSIIVVNLAMLAIYAYGFAIRF